MRGFNPQKNTPKAKGYADGGLVEGFKLAFGLKPRMRDTPEYQQMMRSQQPAQQAPAQTAPAMVKAKPAISQYAGNDALKRRMQEADSYANGGMVRGKGTGTSDEIQDEVPDGTYIMPADTTKTVGADGLRKLGNGNVPVNLSNGEFKMPPEQVHAVGVQALNQIKDATHTPVQRGLPAGAMQSKDPQMFFANGGEVDDPKWSATDYAKAAALGGAAATGAAQSGTVGFLAKTAGGAALDAGSRIANAAKNARAASIPGMPESKLGKLGAAAALGTTAVDVAGTDTQDYRKRFGLETSDPSLLGDVGVRALGAASDLGNNMSLGLAGKYYRDLQDKPAPVAQAVAAAPAPAIVDTAPPKTGEEPLAGVTAGAAANTAGAAAAPAGTQIQPGVYQHGRGQFSDSPDSMGFGNFTGQPNAQNMNAASALSARYGNEARGMALGGGQPQAQQINAPTVLSSANDWASRNALRNMGVSANSIMNRPGGASGSVSGGRGRNRQQPQASDPTGAVAQYNAAVSADLQKQGMQPQADIAAMKENSALQREGIQQSGANARSADQNALKRQELGMLAGKNAEDSQVRGFDIRQAQRKEGILSQYDKATTPEARDALVKQFPDVFGRDKNAQWKAIALQGGTDAMGNKTESTLAAYNEGTGEFRRFDQGAQQQSAGKQERAVGSTSTVNGKTAVWDGSKWVPR